jgi:hypothetical protein
LSLTSEGSGILGLVLEVTLANFLGEKQQKHTHLKKKKNPDPWALPPASFSLNDLSAMVVGSI